MGKPLATGSRQRLASLANSSIRLTAIALDPRISEVRA
jgi:hypothetical protein